MKFFHNHILLNVVSLVLVLFLFAPSIVKLKHAISEHEHFECTSIGKLHIHKVELDCDFEKFNLSPQLYSELIEIPQPISLAQFKVYEECYTFLSKYQKLHFSLRGPPIAS